MAEPLDDSAVAELADLVMVALGLRVVALALYPGGGGLEPRMLVLAEDLPPPAEREAFLARRTPRGSLGRVAIHLQTPEEFQRVPAETLKDLRGARLLLDRQGIVGTRLRQLDAAQGTNPGARLI
jgi:hypothetical protein